jgi:hypothetical protein
VLAVGVPLDVGVHRSGSRPAPSPAETAEGPSFSLHAYTGDGIVSHVVPVGPAATRTAIDSPEFLARVRDVQSTRTSAFG